MAIEDYIISGGIQDDVIDEKYGSFHTDIVMFPLKPTNVICC